MQLFELNTQPNPFPDSKIQNILYHGTSKPFTEFKRPPHGIFVTPVQSWAKQHYGKIIVPLFANVTKMKTIDWNDPVSDLFYDRAYDRLTIELSKLAAEGYNCAHFGGESESMVLFNNIELVNAQTGKMM